MENETAKPNYLRRYIISSYVLVNAMIVIVGLGAIYVLGIGDKVFPMWIVRNIISWSPTYLLLIGWKYFSPNETRMDLIKRSFSGKFSILFLLASFGVTFGMSMLALFIQSCIKGRALMSYFSSEFGTLPIVLALFMTITSGPTGEELGWRGYMREEFHKKYGFLKSSICQGLVWTFWHTLLWAVDTEFDGLHRVLYIIANIVVTTSITVMMNIFLERRNNIIYSIFMHFGFNVIYMFMDMEIEFCVILTILYLIVTPIAVLIRNKTCGKNSVNA